MTAARVQLKIQRGKRRRRLFLGLAAAALAAILFIVLTQLRREPPAPVPSAAMTLAVMSPPPPEPAEYQVKIRSGDTIGKVLARYGFSEADIQVLYDQVKPVFDLRRLRAGQPLRLYADQSGDVVRLEYDIDDFNYLSVEKQDGLFQARLNARPIETLTAMIWGTIEESPILAFNRLGERDQLALDFADLFGWDVDFYIDLRQGDTFKVIFEKRLLDGRFIGYGNILAAELTNQGRQIQAFAYVSPDTLRLGHYDAEGKSLEKEFRKSPIKWARITSRFSSRRLHPIHHVYRAHYGVDYAAPIGTPVQATADGTVTFAGWNGGSGRLVRIRHKNAYETMYLHLSRFGPRIRTGARVTGGDVVGYVGSSGDSTGPHLDYRITRNGSYLNPLNAKFDPVEPIREAYLAEFKASIEKYRWLLASPLALVQSVFF
jgi:murein DD-endopeptidase MepM/ murein hydrolase activator NlpD